MSVGLLIKENVLKVTNGGYDYYNMLYKGQLKVKGNKCENVKSLLYDDTKASVQIKYWENGQMWWYTDYGNPEHSFSFFDFVIEYHKLDKSKDFNKALKIINDDLNLGLVENSTTDINIDKKVQYNISSEDKTKWFTLYERSAGYNSQEVLYLNQYEISKESAREMKVIPIDGYETVDEDGIKKIFTRKPEQILFAFMGDSCAKIYSPHPKYFRYLGSKPKDYIYGWSQIVEHESYGEILFVTAGEKDVLTLSSHGYSAVCLNSETDSLNPEMLKKFKERFENIIVLYDIDETGLRESKRLVDTHGITRLILPDELKEKGGKDIADFFKMGMSNELFDELIKKALENVCSVNIENEELNFPVVITECQNSPRSANQRMLDAKNMPDIITLVDVFWQTNELVVFFGDTGLGKSLFAVQIADKISRGERVMCLDNGSKPLNVLYYDFELSDKQFQKRYSDEDGNLYPFNDNFFIDSINISELYNNKTDLSLDEVLFNKIKDDLIKTKAKVLIIDNITYLKSESPHDAEIALDIMRRLNQLKKTMGLSILVLAHTPKIANRSQLTLNDLAGSKHLSNFADSVFAIGRSEKASGMRYLKQIKPSRSAELKFDSNNVIECSLVKDNNYLGFHFNGFSTEADHVTPLSDEKRDSIKSEAIELKRQGWTYKQLSEKFSISTSTLERWINGKK